MYDKNIWYVEQKRLANISDVVIDTESNLYKEVPFHQRIFRPVRLTAQGEGRFPWCGACVGFPTLAHTGEVIDHLQEHRVGAADVSQCLAIGHGGGC